MGVIVKESLKQSVVKLVLAILGAIATLVIYPLDRELYGILGFVVNTSVLLMPIAMIGLGQASIRFFPYHNSSLEARKEYFYFLFRLIIINSIILVILFWAFGDYLNHFNKNPDDSFNSYLSYALPGAILFALNQFFVQYLSNYKIVALPVVWQNLYRIGLPISFVLVIYNFIDVKNGIIAILISLFIGTILLFWSSIFERSKTVLTPLKQSITKMSTKSFYKYYFWAFASSLGSMVAFKIDVFMISTMLDFKANGDYLIAMFMTNVIAYPIQSVIAISTPIISQAWKDNQTEEIKNIYLKGSRNLLFIGSAILIMLLFLFQILPLILPKWEALKYLQIVVFVIGISKLFDMMSSVNGVIIQHSKWFRYNTYFLLVLTVFNIAFNYIFISSYGILGAALATLISLSLFNILKCVFLYKKIGVQPFTLKTLLFFVNGIIVFYSIIYIGTNFSPFYSIPITLLVTMSYLSYWLFFTDFALETRELFYKFLKQKTKSI